MLTIVIFALGQGPGKSHSGDQEHREQGSALLTMFYFPSAFSWLPSFAIFYICRNHNGPESVQHMFIYQWQGSRLTFTTSGTNVRD